MDYKKYIPHTLVLLTILSMIFFGFANLLSPSYIQVASDNYFVKYQGYIFIFIGFCLIPFYFWLVEKIIWLSQEIYRFISTIIMFFILGIEGAMHFLNIPHVEGWWIPLLSGGAAGIIVSFSKKIKSLCSPIKKTKL